MPNYLIILLVLFIILAYGLFTVSSCVSRLSEEFFYHLVDEHEFDEEDAEMHVNPDQLSQKVLAIKIIACLSFLVLLAGVIKYFS